MPVYLTAVFPKFREEGRMLISKLALCCSVPNLWRGRVGALQTNSVLFAERMGTAPMHNAAPLPAGPLHLTESVDGSIIAMHSISHKIFFLPNRQLNLGACFPHLLFALCFYEFELNTAVKIICYLICVSVGIKADVFFLLMRKWANQYWQTPCLNVSEHLNISSWDSQHCKWASKQTKHTNQ